MPEQNVWYRINLKGGLLGLGYERDPMPFLASTILIKK